MPPQTATDLPVFAPDDPGLREAYERDGVVLVRGLLTPDEVTDVRRNIARYEKWLLDALPEDWSRREPDGSLRGMYFMERVDPYFKALGERPAFAHVVERLTGMRATFASMETFHKPARVGSASLVHQDGVYYVGTPVMGVNMWVALDHSTRQNAALKYWTGTHRGEILAHGGTKEDPYFRAMRPEDVAALGEPSYAELPPGWGAFHSDRIVHGSDPNTSDQQRLAFAATFTLEPRPAE